MIAYPDIDPIAFSIFGLKVHWYGIAYLISFAGAWWLAVKRAKLPHSHVDSKDIEDLIFYGAIGVVLGGRLGYVFFYGFDQFLENPLWAFKINQGGMSFHGGLLGVGAATWYFAWRKKLPMNQVWDFVAPLAPVGLLFGRLGNFIGGELYGRAADVPWAMVFPNDPQQLPFHRARHQ